METVDNILSMMVKQMTAVIAVAIDEAVIKAVVAAEDFKEKMNMALEWKTECADDLSGCWMRVTNWDEPPLGTGEDLEICIEFEKPLNYYVWFIFGEGTAHEVKIKTEVVDSIPEAKQLAEDLLTGFLAQMLFDVHLLAPELVLVASKESAP